MKIAKSLTLDAQVIQAIQALADREGRLFSNYVNWVLLNHIMQKGFSEQE